MEVGGIGERREPSSPTCSQSVSLYLRSIFLCVPLSISLLLSYYM